MMNVRPGIITEEQSAAIKSKWCAAAKTELKVWAVFFILACAIFAEPLKAQHWPVWVGCAIAWASLVLFSRLALWLTFIVAVLAHVVLGVSGHATVATFYVVAGCVWAMILRSPFFLFFLLAMGSSARTAGNHARFHSKEETPIYDIVTDEHVYSDGRRERAYINPKKPAKTLYYDHEDHDRYY